MPTAQVIRQLAERRTREERARAFCQQKGWPLRVALERIASMLAADVDDETRAILKDLQWGCRDALQREARMARKPSVAVPVPKAYKAEVAEKVERARAVSGRDRIRARFVQGGAPGSARKG